MGMTKMKLLLLFFIQVSAQKTECIFCSAKFIDGIGIIDGDASCFEGTTKAHPTWGEVCGSEISRYSWNNELDVYIIDRFSTNRYDDDSWMIADYRDCTDEKCPSFEEVFPTKDCLPTQQISKIKSNLDEIYAQIKDFLPEKQVRSRQLDRGECPFCGVSIGQNSSTEIDECLAGNNVETEECFGWLKCFCGSVYAKRGSKNRDTHCYIERSTCKLFNKIILY